MTFKIDTGGSSALRNNLPTWFLDECADDADDRQLAHDYAYHLIWRTRQPAKLETVRRHITYAWPALFTISSLYPELFDEVMCAYAERALIFDHPNAA